MSDTVQMAALSGSSEGGPDGAKPRKSRISAGFGRYLFNRVSGTVVSLIAVLFSAFFIFRVLPGDPARNLMQEMQNPSPELEAALRAEWGLDEPIWTQFWLYLTGLLQGDLGTSIQYGVPVNQLFMDRLGPTLLLGGISLVLALIIGFSLGSRAAWKHGSRFDKGNVNFALLFFSAPTFWVAMIAIIVFSRELRLFPTGRMQSSQVQPNMLAELLDIGHHLVLPTVTLTAMIYAGYLLTMRASMLDEMGNDYLTTARAKGLRDDVVRRKHATRNALLPTTTVVFMSIGNVINGSLITEMIYSWPGLGYTFYQAIAVPDYPVLQGLFVIFASATVLANLGADIFYWFIDPRARKA
ncbi:MAG TPA: ABC transporter permease [Candidatus Agrococcus pullicola]|uniref:ABC transporter permease n=1 Tax=Candidatus Agrococcus pullicola TaxID=2838429 RepID=A0A9D2CAM2_9MICO|nr:ABC transporter permease [Candidatus Agrococcus pullicola]